MHNMKHIKNKNLISDEQLLRFSDAIASGASFDKAFADAGFFLSDKKEYRELQAYAALEGKLNNMKASMTPDSVFVEKFLAGISLPAAPISGEEVSPQALKSPYVGAFGRMVQLAARPTWKVAAPIAVMFLALSTMLGVSARRDSTVVFSPDALLTAHNTEPTLAMHTPTLITNSANAIPTATSVTEAPQGRMMLMQGNNTNENVADTTPETLDGVFALLEEETVTDVGALGDTDADTVLDVSETNSLTQLYDESTI